MTWWELLLLALATWYTAETIASKDGPWRIFARVRDRVKLGGLLTCIHCLAPWTGLTLWALWKIAPGIIWVLAIAGLALMLRSYTGVRHDGG